MKQHKWIMVTLSALLVIAVAAGVSAFGFYNQGNAKSAPASSVSEFVQTSAQKPGIPFSGPESAEFLANALGITVKELQTAQEKAFEAAVQEALDADLITQAQADRLSNSGQFHRRGLDALLVGPDSGIDMETLLARELGISLDELQAAKAQAFTDSLAQAVEDGKISQEQSDLIKARQALRDYIDPKELQAKALGITADQLEAYNEKRLGLPEILAELGLTETEFQDAQKAAMEAAVAQAVSDGVITQAQADLILSEGSGMPFGLQPGLDPHGRLGGFGPGGPDGNGFPNNQAPVQPSGSGI